jgi:threonine dehydrogenase-like Zn-dependent dehydrogenase
VRGVSFEPDGSISVAEWAQPALAPGDALLTVDAVGVCGSDLARLRSPALRHSAPAVFGHEICGRILATGGPSHLAVGTRVAVDPLIRCGACDACRGPNDAHCARLDRVGFDRAGGYADQVVVPLRQLHPTSLDPAVATLTDPLAVVLHGLALGPEGGRPPSRVAIIGDGPLAALTAHVVAAFGCDDIVAVTRHDRRAQFAFETLAGCRVESVDSVDLATSYPLVIEAAGGATVESLSTAMHLVAPRGHITVLGAFTPDAVGAAPWREFCRKEATAVGSYSYASRGPSGNEFVQALQLLEAGVIDPATIISDRIPMALAADALRDLGDRSWIPAGKVVFVAESVVRP